MKPKLNRIALMAYFAAASLGFAQSSPTETTNPGSGPVFAPLTNDSAAPADTNAAAPAATNPPDAGSGAPTNGPTASVSVTVTNAPFPAGAVPAPSAPVVTNTAETDIIPLIQFVDVPLTAAIENLAR